MDHTMLDVGGPDGGWTFVIAVFSVKGVGRIGIGSTSVNVQRDI